MTRRRLVYCRSTWPALSITRAWWLSVVVRVKVWCRVNVTESDISEIMNTTKNTLGQMWLTSDSEQCGLTNKKPQSVMVVVESSK